MTNEASLFLIRKLKKKLNDEISSTGNLIKDYVSAADLLNARKIDQRNAHLYRNQRDAYVKIDFGNNVVLPFHIHDNIATLIKVSEPKSAEPKRNIKPTSELKKLFELKSTSTLQEVAEAIEQHTGVALRIEEKREPAHTIKKANLEDAMDDIRVSPIGKAIESFVKFATKERNTDEIACDAALLKKIKDVSSVFEMMESKQEALIESGSFKENPYIDSKMRVNSKFNKEDVEVLLERLKNEDQDLYESISKEREQNREPQMKLLGVFHIDEVIRISPSLEGILDMELKNKTDYKIKLSKEKKDEPEQAQAKESAIDYSRQFEGYGDEEPMQYGSEFEEDEEMQNLLKNF